MVQGGHGKQRRGALGCCHIGLVFRMRFRVRGYTAYCTCGIIRSTSTCLRVFYAKKRNCTKYSFLVSASVATTDWPRRICLVVTGNTHAFCIAGQARDIAFCGLFQASTSALGERVGMYATAPMLQDTSNACRERVFASVEDYADGAIGFPPWVWLPRRS